MQVCQRDLKLIGSRSKRAVLTCLCVIKSPAKTYKFGSVTSIKLFFVFEAELSENPLYFIFMVRVIRRKQQMEINGFLRRRLNIEPHLHIREDQENILQSARDFVFPYLLVRLDTEVIGHAERPDNRIAVFDMR